MLSSRKRLLVWATSGLFVSAAIGLTAEQWAMAGADPFYFTKTDAPAPFRPGPVDAPATASEPAGYSFAAYPVTERQSPDGHIADDDVSAPDPWQARLAAEDRAWEARADAAIRRERRAETTAETESDQPATMAESTSASDKPASAPADQGQPDDAPSRTPSSSV